MKTILIFTAKLIAYAFAALAIFLIAGSIYNLFTTII